ncbi:hypothetical protein OA46_04610 [Enterobacter cloacae]|nr:hypothetical protein OA46_04610 [Enterobacter cloacae]
MDYEFFERLDKAAPGSVEIDRENSTVTLKGWKLKEFDNANNQKQCADSIEDQSNGFRASPLKSEDTFPKTILLVNGGFVRVVNPLTNTDSHASKSDKTCSTCWKCGEHASASKQENESSESNQYLVPGIKGQLRKWILQVHRFLFTPLGKF